MSTIETINKVHETLDGYEVRFDGTDDEVLIKAGATRLTETKDIETMSRGFILTETERNAPNYLHKETLPGILEAKRRMKALYHENAVEGNHDLIEKAELNDMSARILFKDGNILEWDIEDHDRESFPESTLLERLLNENFPGGYNCTSDRYFVIGAGNLQFLVLEHAGQWYVGDNIAVTTNGTLRSTEEFEKVARLIRRYGNTDKCDAEAVEDLLDDTMDFIEGLKLPVIGELENLLNRYNEECLPNDPGKEQAEEAILKDAFGYILKVTGYELSHKDKYTCEFSPLYNRILSQRYGLSIYNRENPATGRGEELPYYVRDWDYPVTAYELEHPETIRWPDGRCNPNDNAGPDWEPNA